MVCSMGTAMWKCPICCSAQWVTSWQKSCRKQRMRRNTWSTLSLLCRGQSWIWSFFYLVYAYSAVSLLRGQAPALASKEMWGGGKALVSGYSVSFYCLFCEYCLSSFQVWGEKPQHLSNQTKNPNSLAKLLKCSWLSGRWRFIPFWYLLQVLRFTIGYNQVSGMNVLIIFLNFLATTTCKAWTHPFCFCQCTNSGYLRVHKYLKHIVWLLRNPFGLWLLFEQDPSRELVIR